MAREQILIVEDERAVARGLEYGLTNEGFTVLWAEGSGLGLAIVQSVVQAHGGQVSVESEPGAGSLFVINLGSSRPGSHARCPAALRLRSGQAWKPPLLKRKFL